MEDGVFFFKVIRQWMGDLFSVSLRKPFSGEMNLCKSIRQWTGDLFSVSLMIL